MLLLLKARCYLRSYLALVMGERGVCLVTWRGLRPELQVVQSAMGTRSCVLNC